MLTNYKKLYFKYKSKYLNLKQKYVIIESEPTTYTFDNFCSEIYNNLQIPVNELLANMQRHFEIGYFTPQCVILDPNPPETEYDLDFKSSFANNLNFIKTFDYFDEKKEMLKPIQFLVMLKNVFSEIINDFNKNETNIEQAKQHRIMTIVLSNCVIRIIPLKMYFDLKILYDQLILEDNKWDNFEKIYRIYISEEFSLAIIVSEKLEILLENSDHGLELKEKFRDKKDKIFNSLKESRALLQSINIVHGDLSIDNTGFRQSDNKFVIFDFDYARFKENPKDDDAKIRRFERL